MGHPPTPTDPVGKGFKKGVEYRRRERKRETTSSFPQTLGRLPSPAPRPRKPWRWHLYAPADHHPTHLEEGAPKVPAWGWGLPHPPTPNPATKRWPPCWLQAPFPPHRHSPWAPRWPPSTSASSASPTGGGRARRAARASPPAMATAPWRRRQRRRQREQPRARPCRAHAGSEETRITTAAKAAAARDELDIRRERESERARVS